MEHILKGTPQLIVHFHSLLSGLTQNGFAVTDSLHSSLLPIVKHNKENITDSVNYRPVTLGVIFAQMFELPCGLNLVLFWAVMTFNSGLSLDTLLFLKNLCELFPTSINGAKQNLIF